MLFTKTVIVAAAASLSFLGGNGVIGSSPLEEWYAKDEGSYVKEFGRIAGQNGRVKYQPQIKLAENMSFDEIMSMSMPTPFMPPEEDDDEDSLPLDCSALQQVWDTDPESIKGSDLLLIKEACDQGVLSTEEEVAAAIDAFEGPNPSLDDQFTIMADDICMHALNETDSIFNEIQNACEEDPRDDEDIIDAYARLASEQLPKEGNDGCSKKALRFAEAISKATTEKATDIGENPVESLLKAHSFLEKHTNHLRQSESALSDNSDVYSSVERAMQELKSGTSRSSGSGSSSSKGCNYAEPFSFDPHSGAVSLCLYWSGVLNYGCFGGSCGVGNGAKLNANVNTCLTDKDYSVKLWISSVENFLRKNFNIYSGCLRLAWAEYNISQKRLEVTVGPLIQRWYNIFTFRVGGAGTRDYFLDLTLPKVNLNHFSTITKLTVGVSIGLADGLGLKLH
eukprot:scaffold17714_cov39-Cyclotella_meneghiniana.AAC.2